MSLENAIRKVQGAVPECVAVGYVDISTGLLLAVKTIESHPQEVLDLVSAATADIFQGTTVRAIEKIFKKQRGVAEDNHHYFQEMFIYSDNLLHVFLRCKKNREHILVIVTRREANIGMVLAKSRMSLAEVESAL